MRQEAGRAAGRAAGREAGREAGKLAGSEAVSEQGGRRGYKSIERDSKGERKLFDIEIQINLNVFLNTNKPKRVSTFDPTPLYLSEHQVAKASGGRVSRRTDYHPRILFCTDFGVR